MPGWRLSKVGCFFFSAVVFCFLLGVGTAHADPAELKEIKEKIHLHGAKWEAGETSISILSKEEKKKRLGLNMAALPEGTETVTPVITTTLPATLDYRTYNYVTPVRNQGSCGSCWAFAVTAALESQAMIKGFSTSPNFSEQILVSCSGAGSCSGGYSSSASNYLVSTGLPDETCFPYTATNNVCSNACADWQNNTTKISGWQYVTSSVDSLKAALTNYGPLVVTFNVYSDFSYYKSGVYSYASGSYLGAHAVELIGFDDTAQAFIVKNSWGTGWGEAGFFRIAYSELNTVTAFAKQAIAYNAAACTFSLSPKSASFTSIGGEGAFQVTATTGCNWAASSNASWIAVTSGSSGSGNGTITYQVAANATGGSRSGTVTAAGQTFTITQTSPLSISPTSASFKKAGGSGAVTVSSETAASWTATSNVSWLTVTSGASGTGSGSVAYTVSANTTNRNRSGTMTIAGQTFTVSQTKR